jgi:dual specificity MAP kinase phosphatase
VRSFSLSFLPLMLMRLDFRNHASNVYMLQALGITHVVSVGECALVPPPNQANQGSSGFPNSSHFVPGRPTDHQGSLWMEQRAGRMKVLDIENVCDDGIDTLEPQLEPICDWIDQARKEGGQVLVHCRVGVSRSATVVVSPVQWSLLRCQTINRFSLYS